MLRSAESDKVRLISPFSRKIIFAEFQPVLITIRQRYRQTNRRFALAKIRAPQGFAR